MKKEDKELLLKDLCARLPYDVKVEYNNVACEVLSIDKYNEELTIQKSPGYTPAVYLVDIKPYLFPLSSMTEEQQFDYLKTCIGGNWEFPTLESYEWFNKNHFDYRGLIEKSLALDATGLNIY